MRLIQIMLSFGVFLIKYEANRQLFEEKIAQGAIFYHQLLSWKSPVPALIKALQNLYWAIPWLTDYQNNLIKSVTREWYSD